MNFSEHFKDKLCSRNMLQDNTTLCFRILHIEMEYIQAFNSHHKMFSHLLRLNTYNPWRTFLSHLKHSCGSKFLISLIPFVNSRMFDDDHLHHGTCLTSFTLAKIFRFTCPVYICIQKPFH